MYELYLVTDEALCRGRDLCEVVLAAVEGGVTVVQLREKNLDTRHFVERAVKLKKLLSSRHVPLIINDRIDVALAVGADGVHVGQSDMPYEYLSRIIPKQMLVGLSVENMKQAEEASRLKVDYLGVSPVFPTTTKTNFKEIPWGLEGLARLRQSTSHALVAIGGINASNAASVILHGADGVAVVSAICSAPDPYQAAIELKDIIVKAKNR